MNNSENYVLTNLDIDILYHSYAYRYGQINSFIESNEDIMDENEELYTELIKVQDFYNSKLTELDCEEVRRIREKEEKGI